LNYQVKKGQPYFELRGEKRTALFIKIGWSALFLFIGIDLVPWSPKKTAVFTFLSFMNVAKYPPSLLFCLVTLGIMFLMLALTEGAKNQISPMAAVYGKVPLFYFLAHFFLIHLIMLAMMLGQGFSWAQMDFASGTFGRPKGVESGVELGVIYLIWIGVVIILYKPCLWFGKYKTEHPQWWLKYF
jgi:hypothetical protein